MTNQLDQIKKISSYIAGVACILYGIIGLITGHSFLAYVIYIAVIVLGVSCMIENAEIVGVISAGVMTLFNFFSLVSFFFSLLRVFINGYLDGTDIIFWILSLGISALELVSSAALLIFIILGWKSTANKMTKFWYAPAAVSLLSAFITLLISLLQMILFGYGINFSFLFNVAKTFAVNIIYVVAIAAVALRYYKTETDIIGIIPPIA